MIQRRDSSYSQRAEIKLSEYVSQWTEFNKCFLKDQCVQGNTLNIVEDTKIKTIEWFLELCMIDKYIICKYIWESGTYETVSSNNTSDWNSSDF